MPQDELLKAAREVVDRYAFLCKYGKRGEDRIGQPLIEANALKDTIVNLEDALFAVDKRKTFDILLSDGTKKKVKGYVAGLFGTNSGRWGWTVTHLPTGYGCNGNDQFRTKKGALQFIDAITPLTDWANLTRENAQQLLTPEVREALMNARRENVRV